MMPRFSSSIWCARWSPSRLAISGDRTGRVTTRYISLPRKLFVAGSTLLGTSAIVVSSFVPGCAVVSSARGKTIGPGLPALSFGNSGLFRQVLPQRNLLFHALGRLFGCAALGKAAEIAQLLLDAWQRDGCADVLVQSLDDGFRYAVSGADADPRDHLEAW